MAQDKSSSKPYYVRESKRARHVSIRVSHLGEVEIVVPYGFDRRQLPEILQKRQDWIAKTTQRIAAERQSFTPGAAVEHLLPDQLQLRSIGEAWVVEYQPGMVSGVSVLPLGADRLLVRGGIQQTATCYKAMKHWLSRKAETHFTAWLRQVSRELDLPCNKISVRGQKTLWASCSGKKNISLNYKLLFLPPHLVRYVFIHELCHTIHLNHSDRFWGLVSEKEPNYRQLDAELNKSWPYVPAWVERSFE